jgi:hypothetical protein
LRKNAVEDLRGGSGDGDAGGGARPVWGGGTDNIEVVQAQQLLASANENYIASLNAHNGAKIALATALGVAEEGVPQYLNLKP